MKARLVCLSAIVGRTANASGSKGMARTVTVLAVLAVLTCSLVLLPAQETRNAASNPASNPTSSPASGPTTRPVDPAKVAELIRRLADDDSKVREAATKSLIDMGLVVRPSLEAALKEGKLDMEAATRIKIVLRKTGELTLDLGKNVTMTLTYIPAGKFMIGSPEAEKGRSANEGPRHEVTISKSFYMGIYEVTQQQYEQIMGKNPSTMFIWISNPVDQVSWADAGAFCKKLSQKTGRTVSLPTETRWEYACRAGSTTRFGYGDDDDYSKLGDYAWYLKNSENKMHPVGQKEPNNWGLYDMHGNAWEWCADWVDRSDRNYYAKMKNIDPQGPASGDRRALRGGGYDVDQASCRSAYRAWGDPVPGQTGWGFRVVVEAE